VAWSAIDSDWMQSCFMFLFPGFGWVVDVLWPDADTEAVKGFATEKAATEWIAEHSKGWQETNK